MKKSDLFQDGQQVAWETAGEGVKRQVLGFDDKLMLVKFEFSKGGIGQLHSHPHSQASYVESGVFEMIIGGDRKIIKKGDGYYVPPHTVHGCICLEDGVLVDAFTPARLEFLPVDAEK